MAEAPAWRTRFLQRVVGAHEHISDVHERLVALEVFFSLDVATEMWLEPGPEDWMDSLRLKMGSLMGATEILTSAIVYMEAAWILAMHGGNVNPWEPLPTIYHLGEHHAAVLAALTNLKNSQEMAKSASRIVEWSRGHLWMAIALVLDPGIPDSMALANHENNSAYVALLGAIRGTQAALADATIALQT